MLRPPTQSVGGAKLSGAVLLSLAPNPTRAPSASASTSAPSPTSEVPHLQYCVQSLPAATTSDHRSINAAIVTKTAAPSSSKTFDDIAASVAAPPSAASDPQSLSSPSSWFFPYIPTMPPLPSPRDETSATASAVASTAADAIVVAVRSGKGKKKRKHVSGVGGGGAVGSDRRTEKSLSKMTRDFVKLLDQCGEGGGGGPGEGGSGDLRPRIKSSSSSQTSVEGLDLNFTASKLRVQKRRLYDIVNVLEGVGMVRKTEKNLFAWRADRLHIYIHIKPG